MSAAQFIGWLRSVGVGLAASQGRLRVTAERGALTDKIKQEIAAQKTALLELLEEETAAKPADPIAIAREGALPLSLFQQRLWVIHQFEPESTTYNLATVWLLPASLNAARAADAIRIVVGSNEILRSTFRDNGLAPSVAILPAEAVSIMVRHLSDRSESEQDEIIRVELSQATHEPFDLALEAPVRWTVYQLASDRVAILVVAHHIALDDWSFSLLRRQLEEACAALAAGALPLKPSALQYVDYADWQRRIENFATVAAELDWWERRLAGIPQVCTFPADRAAASDASGSTFSFCWDAGLTAELRSLLRAEGATIYMALVAVCAAVLRAHTGQDDIVLGSPMGMRERPEFETMIGPFVNLLVLRLDLTDDPSFSELLARARDAVLDAYDHREAPFEALVERMHPTRSLERPPLFQVAVVMHNASDEPAAPVYSGGAIHDLTWFAREAEGRIEGSFEFRSDLYAVETIERIVAHLETALRAAVRDPQRRISEISLLADSERGKVLDEFNSTALEVDPSPFIAQFERRAAMQPDQPAICYNGAELTYGGLNQRANQFARYLRSQGLGAGSLVSVCLERSLEMMAALLGVQKAGAAYLPLDPGFPPERLAFMLADSGAAALIATAEIAGRLETPAGLQVIDLAANSSAIEDLEATNLPDVVSADDVAYVIYTSGSTGRPNGVAVSQGALSNFLGAMQRAPGLAPTNVIAAVTTISFDIAALELYLPLTVGSRIELVSKETAADGLALAQLLSSSGATVLQATPATWRLLVEADWRGRDNFLGFCGGETLPRDLADAVLERVRELWNLYGPTETTIWSTAAQIGRDAEAISVGRPIANTRVYVLDPSGQPAAIGVPGEIWIGGDGVATGYHKRPELTAARFTTDPFSDKPNARMYRTGDLGRWSDDGRLFHMGRKDRQVKVRGFRIELGEIEAALCAHPAVRQAVVTARDLAQDQSRLVAYIVYQPGEDLTASQVRAHLRQSLPAYMIPSVFVAMASLPLTPNGKVDLRALPDPFKNAMSSTSAYEPPAPGLEQAIAEIWRDLLQVERIGADDNFFELGGHSLLSLRAAGAIERKTGCRFPPRILFFQSLRQVAAAVRRAQSSEA